ncbi:MAG: PLD nuclease N-terminal domain-containing protein [Salinivirgaceae bacterium]|nr:PLD nuclease N-terminal domain-containing protein [Salinivirgaceae bacterium]
MLPFLGFIGGQELIVIGIVLIFIILLPLLALISVLSNNFNGNDKLIWVLLILFLPFLGALLYFIIGKGKRIK